MPLLRHFIIHLVAFVVCCSLLMAAASNSESGSVYQVLKNYGLPMGLLPKGVKNFSLDDSGKFQVHLDHACNTKFESVILYSMNVTGTLRYGQIEGLSGISAQDLFLWLPVIEIRVDIPSSGVIYFNVSLASKQFSLSSFETPRDCLASPGEDLQEGAQISKTISKIQSGKLLYKLKEETAVS